MASPFSAGGPDPGYMVNATGEVTVDIESLRVHADALDALLAAVTKPAVAKSTPLSTPSVLGQMWASSFDGGPELPPIGVYQYDPDAGWNEDPLEVDDDGSIQGLCGDF